MHLLSVHGSHRWKLNYKTAFVWIVGRLCPSDHSIKCSVCSSPPAGCGFGTFCISHGNFVLNSLYGIFLPWIYLICGTGSGQCQEWAPGGFWGAGGSSQPRCQVGHLTACSVPALTHPWGTRHGHCLAPTHTRAALGSVIPKLWPGDLCSSASTRVAIPIQIAPSLRCVCKRPPDQLFSSL